MGTIHISHHIHHIFQGEDGYCWAAAIAMVLGQRSIEGAFEVARRAGIDRENMAIRDSEIAHAFSANGLRSVTVPAALTVDGLANILRRGSIVLFLSLRPGNHASNGGNKHVIAVRGANGDGSPNTNILLNDPWTTGGATRSFSFLTNQYWSSVDYIGQR